MQTLTLTFNKVIEKQSTRCIITYQWQCTFTVLLIYEACTEQLERKIFLDQTIQ